MLEAVDRKVFSIDSSPTASSRRPFGEYTTTIGMHWDGTYRDRSAYSDGFWTEEDYANYGPRCTHPEKFAKHLA